VFRGKKSTIREIRGYRFLKFGHGSAAPDFSWATIRIRAAPRLPAEALA
jgi:hypothetical protein